MKLELASYFDASYFDAGSPV